MIAARQIAFGKGAGKKEETPAYWGLCFTAEEAGSTVAMQAVGSAPSVTLETSYDGKIWEPFTVGGTTITLPNVGDKVYFRAGEGGNPAMASSFRQYNKFSIITGRISASGNIMSLLNRDVPDSIMPNYCYSNMFYRCTSLVQAPELPATTLANYCYNNMFYGCTSLVQAPELPATTLANYCYNNMFWACTSLAQAPELPATTLATGCYNNMFRACEKVSLISTRQTSFTGCTNWLSGVAQSGIFYCPTSLGTDETISRGGNACPEGWTVINKD